MISAGARRAIYVGTFVHTPTPASLEILENAAVFVDEAGVIVHIDRDAAAAHARINQSLGPWSGVQVVSSRPARNEFFFPGFVDTHIHASQYANAGIFGKSTLLDWLEKYTFPLEASLCDCKKARRVYARCVARSLAHGTTTASYFAARDVASTNTLADVCVRAGQRAFVGRVCMDTNSPDWYRDADPASALRDTEAVVAHCRSLDPDGRLLRPIVTPRFAPTCSGELLAALGSYANREDLPIQTHLSENAAEVAMVAGLFPDSKSYTDVYDSCGLLTERTILAHAVHLTDAEMELVRRRGAGVSHCPVSNAALASGCAPVKALIKRGINVGLGTDVSGGYSASVLEAVRQATLVSRIVSLAQGCEDAKLSIAEALYLGTRGGAHVVGLGDRVGAFQAGMLWDAVLVGLDNVPLDKDDDDDDDDDDDEGDDDDDASPDSSGLDVDGSPKDDGEEEEEDLAPINVLPSSLSLFPESSESASNTTNNRNCNDNQGEGEGVGDGDGDDEANHPRASTGVATGRALSRSGKRRQKQKEKKRRRKKARMESDATTGAGASTDDVGQQLKDAGPVDVFGWEDWEEKVAKWVYIGDDRNTQAVWVGGVEVYRKGGIAPTWEVDPLS